jgi:hypothetical protein
VPEEVKEKFKEWNRLEKLFFILLFNLHKELQLLFWKLSFAGVGAVPVLTVQYRS